MVAGDGNDGVSCLCWCFWCCVVGDGGGIFCAGDGGVAVL